MKPLLRYSAVLVMLLVFTLIFSFLVTAEGIHSDSVDLDNDYYRVSTIMLENGRSIDEIVINGPPIPPSDFVRSTVSSPKPNETKDVNIISDVPAFNWSFGCAATSAAMISGYYDRTGYSDMYTGPTNGGLMPLDNSVWPDWTDSSGATRHQCPLSATHDGLDGRTTNGHVDDYWIQYGSTDPDPFIGNWTEHTYGDCTGDYMKTNQSNYENSDGSTRFYYYSNGAPLYWTDMEEANGIHTEDGGYGFKLFYESRGYTVSNMYNQYIIELGNTYGFTYDQYKAEIDAGRPVMIHVEGHTMVGIGYDDSTNLMYIHDTWDYNTHTMTWGGSYSGMPHLGVTIVQLEPLSNSVIIIEKQTDPDGATESFEFSTDYSPNFFLHDDETNNSGPLTPGTYSVSEVNIPIDWTLTSATCDDGSDPSDIDLQAGETVTCTFTNTQAQPEMDVEGNSVSIADGDTTPTTADDTDFGSVDVSAPAVAHTFTIENTGDADLDLTGSPRVSLSTGHSGDFSVVTQPTTPVASGGGTTTFTINFTPSDTGLRWTNVIIGNTDADENPYTFVISGTGATHTIFLPLIVSQ